MAWLKCLAWMTSSTGIFNYWSFLCLSPDSDSAQLKKAFRREAMRWHPDLNKNSRIAEERFKWVNEAYKVLNDPGQRFQWEQAGRPSFEIKEVTLQPIESCFSQSDPEAVQSVERGLRFNNAEQLLLVLISIISLFFFNSFIL